MKVAFFGTPEFSIPSLERFSKSRHQLVGVVTAPDRPRGRGKAVSPTPIAEAAQRLGLPILKPVDFDNSDFLEALRAWNADVFAVVAFRILPEAVFAMPKFGSINLHASLLPAYRGAAPIQWALWNGEKETGVTTFQIQQKVDSGNIYKQVRVEISDDDDAGSLGQKLAEAGARLLVETISELETGRLQARSQNTDFATRAPKITREHTIIDWKRPAGDIRNQIRALAPQPGASTSFDGHKIKIYRSEVNDNPIGLKPGELTINDQSITAGTGAGELRIMELQIEGKKRMNTTAFLRGFRPRGVFKLIGEKR